MGIANEKKIFCNRSLNMENIKAIGFDMDYTLAIYKENFEQQSYIETLNYLISNHNYPQEIKHWPLDLNTMARGLVIDTREGNILKMDRHKYVKLALHGEEMFATEKRKFVYHNGAFAHYKDGDLVFLDTLFMLTEAYLFSRLIQYKHLHPKELPWTYSEIYYQVRHAVDTIHRMGKLKPIVAQNPEKYVEWDNHLWETMMDIKQAGKKLFIVTNSHWDYAKPILDFLFQDSLKNNGKYWLEYFDVVITNSQKPKFFMDPHPLQQLQEKVFEGGFYLDLHRLLDISSGSEILYVGDHIYGDILRSKKDLGWRTMFIITELEKEIMSLESCFGYNKLYEKYLTFKEFIDFELYEVEKNLRKAILNNEPQEEWQTKLIFLKEQKQRLRQQMGQQLQKRHGHFHPLWGELMKTGHQNSFFAAQVQSYACLYTSQVSNLRFYLPHKTFLSDLDTMPHDGL